MSRSGLRKPSLIGRWSGFLHRHPRLKLALLLIPPMGWMLIVYLGALALLFATAFWRQDPLTAEVVRDWGVQNFKTLATQEVYRRITLRTAGIAAAVTLTDVVMAIPVAYYAARIASSRARTIVLLSVVLPLWSSYLARAYTWRLITSGNGVLTWSFAKLGLGAPDLSFSNWAVWLTFSYLWLPFVILPIYAAMDRVPGSLIEASSDLGARWFKTFRRVILPIAFPGVVAGSIFSFSLTLGDYITPPLVGNSPFIGNVIYQYVGISNNLPLAAAFALVPVGIMGVYLMAARKMKAFEAL